MSIESFPSLGLLRPNGSPNGRIKRSGLVASCFRPPGRAVCASITRALHATCGPTRDHAIGCKQILRNVESLKSEKFERHFRAARSAFQHENARDVKRRRTVFSQSAIREA